MMLGAGWPANVQGEHNQTPLHWAAFHGNVEMVRELLLHDALLEAEEQQFNGTRWVGRCTVLNTDGVATRETIAVRSRHFSSRVRKCPDRLRRLRPPEEVLEVVRRLV